MSKSTLGIIITVGLRHWINKTDMLSFYSASNTSYVIMNTAELKSAEVTWSYRYDISMNVIYFGEVQTPIDYLLFLCKNSNL